MSSPASHALILALVSAEQGTVASDLAAEREFWSARPVLAHLHQYARSRRAAPWAVLGGALARVVVATPPMVVLPPLVGGDASLNLFVAIVGASGAGKGASTSVAAEALPVGLINSFPVGSGEGLTHLFVKRTKDGGIEQHTYAVLSTVNEVDTLTALAGRQGATLLSVLRQAYMGEEFGFGYADPAKRLMVSAHTYRFALIVGVQPARAQALLDDTDGGTPQRFLWMPSEDPDAPDTAPDSPKPWHWKAPTIPAYARSDNHRPIPVCDTAMAAIDAGRLARVRGEQSALDGHALLCREKVGAALGLLDGRAEVSEEDWELAGIVMAVSDRTRADVQRVLRSASRSSNAARADAEGDRAVIVFDKVAAGAARKVERRVLAAIRAGGTQGATRATVARSLSSAQRHLLEEALAALVETGHITVEETEQLATGGGGKGSRYRIAEGVG